MIIKTLDQVTEYPLCWPDSKPRGRLNLAIKEAREEFKP